MRYNSQGLKRDVALQIVGVSKHQYYYTSKKTKQGMKTSTTTSKDDGTEVENKEIVLKIKELNRDQCTQYGYQKTSRWLQQEGFFINKKKVYRLMKSHQLLQEKRPRSKRVYAKYRKVLPEAPLHLLEMDIKMTWIESVKKHAYTLTLIDTFTRVVLHRITQYSIKKMDVKRFWDYVIIHHLQPEDCLKNKFEIEIRNDNDKRFSAQLIRDYFKENHLNQVFTHPYTPQENGHVESFHAILSKHLAPYLFWDLDELETHLKTFYQKYNYERLHSSVANLSPMNFWKLYKRGFIDKKVDLKNRKIKFKLNIPYQNVRKLTGKIELEGSSLHDFEKIEIYKKRISAESLPQLTV